MNSLFESERVKESYSVSPQCMQANQLYKNDSICEWEETRLAMKYLLIILGPIKTHEQKDIIFFLRVLKNSCLEEFA